MAKINLTTCINIKTSIMNDGNLIFLFLFFENAQIMSCANCNWLLNKLHIVITSCKNIQSKHIVNYILHPYALC